MTRDITAIVTVADNGGSSGRLRSEFNSLPPGDLRMALAALCGDDEWGRSWAELLQYRFTSAGPLDGHALGNLLLTALWQKIENPIAGLDRVGELLRTVGRVLPMAITPVDIEATFLVHGEKVSVRGQKEVALAIGELDELHLISETHSRSAPLATEEALAAIAQADWITFGPGSWISSVLPHLLLERQRIAIENSPAKRILLLNLDSIPSDQSDEFAGRPALAHIETFRRYAPEMKIDFAVADSSIVDDGTSLSQAIADMGGELIVADIASSGESNRHDREKLTSILRHIFSGEVLR